MRLRKPSPAMVVALIALVMASTGSAIAAVSYATNAGAVDGKSAVGADASLSQARGKLVATARGGVRSGRIPGKFLADVARAKPFAVTIETPDNGTGAPVTLLSQADTANLGRLTASCADRNPVGGVENPDTTIAFANTTGRTANIARRIGNGNGTVTTVAANAVHQFRIAASDTFTLHIQEGRTQVLVEGVVREEGAGTASGSCIVYGTLLLIR